MAYKLNIGKVANQASAPVKMVGSPMQQKNLNFKGNDGSKPSTGGKPRAEATVINDYTFNPDNQNVASEFRSFMNKPISSTQSTGFKLNLPKPTLKSTLPGAIALGGLKFAQGTKDVKAGKSNLANLTNITNTFQNSPGFQNAQSLYEGAEAIRQKYPGCGWNGMECLPTTDAILSGEYDWTNFVPMANIDAGNTTWGSFTASTPENEMSAEQIQQNLDMNQANIANQQTAAGDLKSAKRKRVGSSIGGAIIGGGLNYLANVGINKLREKIKEKKEKKKQPKFD